MAFHLDRDALPASLKRTALSQIGAAIEAAGDAGSTPDEAAFRIRKRCKKLRALLRLIRPGFADYAVENAAFRAIAKPLSPLRDADAMIATYDRLVDGAGAPRRAFAPVRRRLVAQRRSLLAQIDGAGAIADAGSALDEAQMRVAEWPLDGLSVDAVEAGFRRTGQRASEAMAAAGAAPSAERLHAWRRHAKYHWHHCRLLRDWDAGMGARAAEADWLAKALGEHHDLALLVQAARGTAEHDALNVIAAARQAKIEVAAFERGVALFDQAALAILLASLTSTATSSAEIGRE